MICSLSLVDLAYLSPTGETGELLGTHEWSEEMLKEARGDFLFVHVSRSSHFEAMEVVTRALSMAIFASSCTRLLSTTVRMFDSVLQWCPSIPITGLLPSLVVRCCDVT